MIKATAELNFQLSQRNINQLLSRVQSQMKGVELRINTSRASKDIDDLGRSLNRATGFAGQFGLAVGESARKFSAYALAATTISKLAGLFSSATAEVLKFDKDLVKLSQVTGKFGEQLGGITKHLLDLSVRTGISIGKLGELTTTLAQADLKGRDLANAIEVIAKSDLAPSFENMTDSVEGLIAIMQQFKRPSSELIKQFGYINNLSKQSAVESADLIEAVKRSGSVFESAGASLEEFAAMMAVVRSTTRESAETIATGLKTIVERIQRPEIIDQLRQLGVELENVEGKFVGPRIAFERLSEALRRRGSLEKGSFELINVAKEIGGGRQLSKLIPLLNSGAQSARMMERAMQGAATSIDDDAAIAMKSLSKQIDVLKAKFTKFFVEFSLSDEFKEMAKAALTFADAMLEVLKATKPFIPLAANIGTFLGARFLYQGFSGRRTPRFKTATPDGFYSGGRIKSGSGQPGVDDVLIAGAKDEFMMSKKASRGLGYANLEYMNRTGKLPHMYSGGRVGGGGLSESVSGMMGGIGGLLAYQLAIGSLSDNTEEAGKGMKTFSSLAASSIPTFIILYKGFQTLTASVNSLNEIVAKANAKSLLRTEMKRTGQSQYISEASANRRKAGMSGDLSKFSSVKEAVQADPITQRVMEQTKDPEMAKLARRAFYDVSQKSGDYKLARDEAFKVVADAYEKRANDLIDQMDKNVENAEKAVADATKAFKSSTFASSPRSLADAQSELDTLKGKLVFPKMDSLRRNESEARKKQNAAYTRKVAADTAYAKMQAGTGGMSLPAAVTKKIEDEYKAANKDYNAADQNFRKAQAATTQGNTDLLALKANTARLAEVAKEVKLLKDVNESTDKLNDARQQQAKAIGPELEAVRKATKLRDQANASVAKETKARDSATTQLAKKLAAEKSASGKGVFGAARVTTLSANDAAGRAARNTLLTSSQKRVADMMQQRRDLRDQFSSTSNATLKGNRSAADARLKAAESRYAVIQATGAGAGGVLDSARKERAAAKRALQKANAEIAQRAKDEQLYQTVGKLIPVVGARVASLRKAVEADRKLTAAETKAYQATTDFYKAKAAGWKAGIFSRGRDLFNRLKTDPAETWRSRGQRWAGQAGDFIESKADLIGGVFASAVALAVAQLNALAEAARENAQEAISKGNAREAYSETVRANDLENRSSDMQIGGAVGAGVGVLASGAIAAKIGAVLGTTFAPVVGTAIGAAVGGGLGVLVASFGKIGDGLTSLFTGRDRNQERITEARAASRSANIASVSMGIDKALQKFAEATAPNVEDRSRGRDTLAAGIESAIAKVKATDATTQDTREELIRLYTTTADELRLMGDEALKNGKGFEAVSAKAPELVKWFNELTVQLGDVNFDEQTKQMQEFYNSEAKLRSQERDARTLALVELKKQIEEQRNLSDAIRSFGIQTVAMTKATENVRTISESISGEVSSRAIKEFGISLTKADTILSDEFEATLDAMAKLNPSIEGQIDKYRDLVTASEIFAKQIPLILNKQTPNEQSFVGRQAVRDSFGSIDESLANDFAQKFDELIKAQEGSALSAQERAKQFKDLSDSMREAASGDLGKQLEDFRTGEINDRFTALSDKIAAETELRVKSIDRMLEANQELETFSDNFRKTTFAELTARRNTRTDAALKGTGETTTGNSVADYQRLSALRKSLVSQLAEINNRDKNNRLTEQEIIAQGKLVSDINSLSKAMLLLTDTSAELAKLQENLAIAQDQQTKLRSKASELAFGGPDSRNQFARALTAQKFVSAGGNLQSLPEEIRGELFSFLQEFGDAKVFNGESGTEIINKQTANFLRGLGFSNDAAMSLITDMVPIEQRQLDELKKIVRNTAAGELAGFSMGGKAKGVDTIPAMVRPGEVIVSRDKARKNKGVLDRIQSGTLYASTGGEVMPNGTLRKPKSTPLHESIKQMHQDNLQKMYDRGAKIRSDADKVKKRKIRSFDPYEATTNAMYDIMYQGRRFLEYTRESRDQAQLDSLSSMKTPSSSLDATDKFKNKYLPHQGGKYTREYAGAVNQYNGQTAYINSPDRLTADEKLDIAQKHARYLAEGGAARDRTGMSKKFNADSVLLYGLEGGSAPLSPTRGQSGLGNKLGLNRWEQQSTGFKPADMLAMADEKARNPEAAMRASKSREKELARIATYREAKKQEKLQSQFDATVEYGKSLFGFSTPKKAEPDAPIASTLKKAKDKVASRLIQAGSKQLKFAASNEQIMTKDVLENMMNSLVNPNNLLNTRRQLGVSNAKTNEEFINRFKTQTAFTANQYGNVMSLLFGTGSGTNGNSLATSLFSKPIFKNGVFQSAVLNEQFLKDNADKINQIRPQLDELANFGSASDIGKYVDKLSNKRFSKTMINLREAVNQSMRSIQPTSEYVTDPISGKQYNPKTGQMPNGNFMTSKMPKLPEYKGLFGDSKAPAIIDNRPAQQAALMDNMSKALDAIKQDRERNIPKFHSGGIAGEMDVRVLKGEGIVNKSAMAKMGANAFKQLNKTGELPQDQLQSTIDSFMKTPPWMKDFQSSVATLAGTSIKAELAPVSINVKINGAEVLASIQGQMKDIVRKELMSAILNIYHDNSGRHILKGMPNGIY